MVKASDLTSGNKKASIKRALETVSSEQLPFWSAFRMVVIGPPGVGKSHLGLTASGRYREEGGCELDDIIFVQTDPLGLAGAKERNILVPRVVDMSTFTDEDMSKVFMELPTYLASEVEKQPTRACIVDTASVLFGAVCTMQVRSNEGPKAYNEFARLMRDFFSKCKPIPVPLVFTMHVRVPRVIMNAKGNFIADSASAAGLKQGQLSMDIEGNKGTNVIRGMSTLTGSLSVKELPGNKMERTLKFKDVKSEGKMRLTECVNVEEPANLSPLFEKIAEKCKAPLPGTK